MIIFWVKTSIILWYLAQIFSLSFQKQNNIQFCEIFGYKKKYDNKFFFTPLFCCCFWIRDPGSEMGKNQDLGSGINIPDPQQSLKLNIPCRKRRRMRRICCCLWQTHHHLNYCRVRKRRLLPRTATPAMTTSCSALWPLSGERRRGAEEPTGPWRRASRISKGGRWVLFFVVWVAGHGSGSRCSVSVGDPDPQDSHVLYLQDPDPLVRGTDLDPAPDPPLLWNNAWK